MAVIAACAAPTKVVAIPANMRSQSIGFQPLIPVSSAMMPKLYDAAPPATVVTTPSPITRTAKIIRM